MIMPFTVFQTNKLTNFMEQTPCETVTQLVKNSLLFMEPMAHYLVHKSLPLVPILSHIHPIHIFPPSFPNINPNTIYL